MKDSALVGRPARRVAMITIGRGILSWQFVASFARTKKESPRINIVLSAILWLNYDD